MANATLRKVLESLRRQQNPPKVIDPPVVTIPFQKVTMGDVWKYDLSVEMKQALQDFEVTVRQGLAHGIEAGTLNSLECHLEGLFIRGFIQGRRFQAGEKQ